MEHLRLLFLLNVAKCNLNEAELFEGIFFWRDRGSGWK